MQVKCEYCGAYIEDKDEFCCHCGAVNAYFNRSVDGTPKTIEELKAWYKSKNLPPEEVTRFFIGKNYQGARAIGIYEENGEYIVYKNKDDGSRAVRYNGKDEAYAVNEVYLKLKSEILNQKAHNLNNRNGIPNVNNRYGNRDNALPKFSKLTPNLRFLVVFLSMIVLLIATLSLMKTDLSESNGFSDVTYTNSSDTNSSKSDNAETGSSYSRSYYSYDNNIYYCDNYASDRWYIYDRDDRDYYPVDVPKQMYDDIQSYRYADNEEWDNSIERFEDTETGQLIDSMNEYTDDSSFSDSSSSSDSDSDYKWNSSDSWDSSSSDWGSDWDSDW